MKLSKIYYQAKGTKTMELLTAAKFISVLRTETEIEREMAENFIKLIESGADELEDLEEIDPAWHAWAKKTFAHIASAMEKSNEYEAKLKAAEEAEKNRKVEEGRKTIILAHQGHATAAAKVDDAISRLGSGISKKFVVGANGLKINGDKRPTADEYKVGIAAMSEFSEGISKINGTMLLVIGDMCLECIRDFGEKEGNELINQVVAVHGQAKNTVRDSIRVVNEVNELYPDKDDRPTGLTYTHWQEIKNYSKGKDGKRLLPVAKVKEIIETVVEGRDEGTKVGKTDGSTSEIKKVLPVKATRELLQKARGGKINNTKNKEDGKPDGYFYVLEDGTTYHSMAKSLKMCADPSVVVIDIKNGVTLAKDGTKLADIAILPLDMCDPDKKPAAKVEPKAEPKPEAVKKPAATTPAKKKVISAD